MAKRIAQGPPWLQDAINDHADEIEQNKPITGIGATVVDSPTGKGRSVNVQGSSAGGGSTSPAPFAILLRKVDGDWLRGVTSNCYLFPLPGEGEALEDFDPVEITGGLADDADLEDDGWAPTEDGDEIWIEVLFETWPGTYTAAIKSKSVDGDIFSSGRVEHDGGSEDDPPEYVQTKGRVLIGRVEDISEEEGVVQLVVRQFLTTNLVLAATLTDGKASDGGDKQPVDALVLVPYF